MSISSTASAGVGGWDYSTLLNNLAAAEQQRVTPYTNLQTSYNNKISAWGSISSLMTTLQDTVKKLNSSAFNTMTVSTNDAFTATATDSASADTHSVTVEQLAIANKMRTGTYASADDQLGGTTSDGSGTRTLTIDQGDGTSMKVELKDDETSLSQIASAINKKGGGVTATVQRNSDGEYQLMLSSKKTGTDGEMTVSVANDDKLGEVLNSSNLTQVSPAQDAKLRVDGTEYTESSNSISDIIPGVTLNLKAPSANQEVGEQLTLTVDTSAIKTTLQDFVKQYNALLTETSADSKFVSSTSGSGGQSGVLMGDDTLRGMVSELRSAVNGAYGDSKSLSDIGIKIDSKTGQMTMDESKLDKAIEDDPDAIGKMFKGSDGVDGMASTLGSIITRYTGDTESNTDGVIKATTDSLNDQLKTVGQQITKTQALVDSQVELYRVQFANADQLFNQMSNLQNTLTSMFAKL